MEEREVMLEEEIMEGTEERDEQKSGLGTVAKLAIGFGCGVLAKWVYDKTKEAFAKRKEENQSNDGTIEGSYTDKTES